MIGPFPLDAFIAQAATVPGVRIVGSAADLDAALSTPPKALPAIYVLSEEKGDKSIGVTGLPMQDITVTVKCVMWVRHAGGAAKVVAAMTDLERDVRRLFFGWRPDPGFRPMTILASGNEQAYGDQLVRQLLLNTSYRQTSEVSP